MGKLGIILFSGTTDKLLSAGILAQSAAVMDNEVKVFVTFWAAPSFTKGEKKMSFPSDVQSMVPFLTQRMKDIKMASWYDMLKEAKSMGAKIYLCSLVAELMNIKMEDLDPIVDDVVGAGTFIQETEGWQVLFI